MRKRLDKPFSLWYNKDNKTRKENKTMKLRDKILVWVVTIVIIGGTSVFLYGVIKEKQNKPQTYPMMTVVVDISRANDNVTVKDFNGNLWQFKGCEDWMIGDICSCIMDNKGTEEIKDDEIIDIKYDGWLEGWVE